MNGALLLLVGILFYVLAYRFYGRYLTRLFGVDPDRPTPAYRQRDEVDYVPTRPSVLFGHHFASIAGAGPIVGPVLASAYGWGAVALWLLLGCVTIGAMHDFAAMFLSVRHRGQSIAAVIEDYLGYAGRQMFLLFCWATLVLVIAVFAQLVARTFAAEPAVATTALLFIGIACPFGWLTYRRGLRLGTATAIFLPLMLLATFLGQRFALPSLSVNAWLAILLAYGALASILPVWLLLQPRDYLNAFLLYALMIFGLLGIFLAAPSLRLEAFTGWKPLDFGHQRLGLFPAMFVTVACGACSGFHALVASGTSSKQVAREGHILPVAYGSMLVEGVLGLMALISVAYLGMPGLREMMGGTTPVEAFARGLAGFGVTLGVPEATGRIGVMLAVSAFLLTTLDTATRLARFTWQELFSSSAYEAESRPAAWRRLWAHPVIATLLAVLVAALLSTTGGANRIWGVFGASNQLLAALTLLGITLYLVRRRLSVWPTLPPFIFMASVSGWALWRMLRANLPIGGNPAPNLPLACAAGFLLLLSLLLLVGAGNSLARRSVRPLTGD